MWKNSTYLINVEEKREIEKSPLKPQYHHINNYCKQAPLMDNNKIRRWKLKENQDFLHSLKITLPKYLWTTVEK